MVAFTFSAGMFPHSVQVVPTAYATDAYGAALPAAGTPGAPVACLIEPKEQARETVPAGKGASEYAVTPVWVFFPSNPGVAKGSALLGAGDWSGTTFVVKGAAWADAPGLWRVVAEVRV